MGRYFKVMERKTSLFQEMTAGTVTFLTIAYILSVNANILSDSGEAPCRWQSALYLSVAGCALTTPLFGAGGPCSSDDCTVRRIALINQGFCQHAHCQHIQPCFRLTCTRMMGAGAGQKLRVQIYRPWLPGLCGEQPFFAQDCITLGITCCQAAGLCTGFHVNITLTAMSICRTPPGKVSSQQQQPAVSWAASSWVRVRVRNRV